jgi:hypothetical protein
MAGKKQLGGNINPWVNAEQWPPPCDVLIVGGGGGGAYQPFARLRDEIGNAGGGGGEVVFLQNFIPPLGTSAVDVGQGGWGNAGSSDLDINAPGSASRIFGITAQGGNWRYGVTSAVGHIGHYIPQFAGYGTNASNTIAPAAATSGYGFFGGGGGGAGHPSTTPSYAGGAGGGGSGGFNGNAAGSGVAGTGGGGGAGDVGGNTAGQGASGIIVIRYPNVYPNVSNILGLFTTKSYDGYKYYAFQASGAVDTISF